MDTEMLSKSVPAAVASVVTAAVVLVALVLTTLLALIPLASGGTSLTVWTGSMEPSIERGSMIVVRPVNPFRLAPGDVITYQVRPDDPTFVTHRVVEVRPDAEPPSVITKGDANASNDPEPIPMAMIRGRVLTHVPYVGHVGEHARSPMGITAALFVGGLLAMFSLGSTVVREARKKTPSEDLVEGERFSEPSERDSVPPSGACGDGRDGRDSDQAPTRAVGLK
jgi:signal peptidase I